MWGPGSQLEPGSVTLSAAPPAAGRASVGALLTVDVAETVRELEGHLIALADRSHGGRIQDYDTPPA